MKWGAVAVASHDCKLQEALVVGEHQASGFLFLFMLV